MKCKTINFTGHRKIYGNWINSPKEARDVVAKVKDMVYYYSNLPNGNYRHYISGMALGFDMVAATAVIECKHAGLDVNLTAAIPYQNQTARWRNRETIEWYNWILQHCSVVETLFPNPTSTQDAIKKLDLRNHWMVDNADGVIGYFDGKPKGGTNNCLRYAQSQGKPCVVIDAFNIDHVYTI